jgi:hypothetical protein
MCKKTLLTLAVLALASVTAFAASKDGIITSKDGRKTIATERAKSFTPFVPGKDPVIYGNFAIKYPDGVYWCCEGGTISGPNSVLATEYWEAAGFTPSASVNVTKIKVAVGYVTGTTTDVILSLNDDANGIPGNVIKKWKVKNLNTFGSCCTVESKSGSIAVTAGTPYWVVVSTEATSDIWAAWNIDDTLQLPTDAIPSAYYTGGVWTGYQGYPGFAFEVDGK